MCIPVKKVLRVVRVRQEVVVAVTKPRSDAVRLSRSSPLVRRLKQSVALLPAYAATAAADAPPTYTEMGLRYTRYSEDSLADNQRLFGASDRYDINITQLWLEAPVGDSWSVAIDVQNDYQTGASPWFVGVQGDGQPGVIMSGASIQDNRVEVGVTTRYFWADGNVGFNITHSDEDDYEALSWSADMAWNSDDNARTWSASVSQSNDTVEPTQEKIPVFIDREDIDTQSAYFGVSQILSRTAILRVGLSYTYSDGYLTDPYKLRDKRPSDHSRWAFTTGYRKHLVDMGATVQADYRFYSDDWSMDSHTLTLGWSQPLGRHTLKPYVRYYSQRAADFFDPVADFTADYYADDYRLSAFGALTLGLNWQVQLGDWVAEAQVERYRSNNSWGLYGGDAAPALVDFWRGTIGLTWRFE